MSVDEEFQAATVRVKKLSNVSGNEQLLELYALFKQATEGDVTGTRPGVINFKGRAKYDAWSAFKGKSKDDAKRAYVDTVARLEKL